MIAITSTAAATMIARRNRSIVQRIPPSSHFKLLYRMPAGPRPRLSGGTNAQGMPLLQWKDGRLSLLQPVGPKLPPQFNAGKTHQRDATASPPAGQRGL